MSTVEGLIDVDYCPNCNAQTQRDTITKLNRDQATDKFFQLQKCHLCQMVFCYVYKEKDSTSGKARYQMSRVTGNLYLELDSIFPKQSEVKTDFLKNKIKNPYLEGVKCLDIFCPNAAVMMFRRTLSLVCIELGADIHAELKEQLKILPTELHLTATEIRKWGNLGAHYDSTGKITEVKTAEAREIKEFLERVFLVVYELPERLKISAKKRN